EKQLREDKMTNVLKKESLLTINVSNYLSFKTSDDKLETIAWRTSKARELFLYLLQNEKNLVRKSTLIELLWPDFDEERALAQLYTTVYHVRKVLQRFNGHFALNNVSEGYVLTTENVIVDLQEWKDKLLL